MWATSLALRRTPLSTGTRADGVCAVEFERTEAKGQDMEWKLGVEYFNG